MTSDANSEQIQEQGFSLLEVLVAMLIVAVAVGGTMLVHSQNLRQVSDTAELNRAELVLTNMVARMQANRLGLRANAYVGRWSAAPSPSPSCVGTCTPVQWASAVDIPTWQNQAFEIGLIGATLSVTGNNPYAVQMSWPAHDVNNAVWRAGCGAVIAGQHCLVMEVSP